MNRNSELDRGRPPAAPWRGQLLDWLHRWGAVLLAFAISRLMVYWLIRLSKLIIVPGPYWHRGGVQSVLTQADGVHFLKVAQEGYSSGAISLAGFFPFYPGLVRAFAFLFGNYSIVALVVSNVCLVIAGILLKELVDLEYRDRRIAQSAVMMLMFSPVAFLFSSAVSESTFLMLALAALFAARRDRWLVACLAGMCLSATDAVGFLIIIPLAWEYVTRGSAPAAASRSKALLHPRAFLLALVPLGCGLFLFYSHLRFHDTLAPFKFSHLWRGAELSVWPGQEQAQSLGPFYRYFPAVILSSGVAIFVGGALMKLRRSYLLYAASLILVFACARDLPSIARHLSVVFPLFISLALLNIRFSWAYELAFVSSVTLMGFCTILAANGHWMR